jgi:hypothetical protein
MKAFFSNIVYFFQVVLGFRNIQLLKDLYNAVLKQKTEVKFISDHLIINTEKKYEILNSIPEALNKVIEEVNENTKQSIAALEKIQAVIDYKLSELAGKSYMPVLLTSKGVVINLQMEKKLHFDVQLDPINNVLVYMMTVDNRVMDTFRVDLLTFNEQHPDKPIFDLGRVLLNKRTEGLTSAIALRVGIEVILGCQLKERLDHKDVFNICVFSFIEAVRPKYDEETANKEAAAKKQKEKNEQQTENQSKLKIGIDGEGTIPKEAYTRMDGYSSVNDRDIVELREITNETSNKDYAEDKAIDQLEL